MVTNSPCDVSISPEVRITKIPDTPLLRKDVKVSGVVSRATCLGGGRWLMTGGFSPCLGFLM
jgi:hypothetical protein